MKIAIDYGALQGQATPNIPAGTSIGSLITKIMALVIPIAGMLMLIFLIWAGYQYMTSFGDPKTTQLAKQNITYAIIGFIVIAFAYIVVGAVGGSLDIQLIKDIFPS